jgi:hypothetical protein
VHDYVAVGPGEVGGGGHGLYVVFSHLVL